MSVSCLNVDYLYSLLRKAGYKLHAQDAYITYLTWSVLRMVAAMQSAAQETVAVYSLEVC